jgi:hypothetical protein
VLVSRFIESGGIGHPVLAGLNGWFRWSSWAAHFFRDGRQLCNISHGNYMGGNFEPKRPNPADLAPSGEPYGRVCQRCLRLSRKPFSIAIAEDA